MVETIHMVIASLMLVQIYIALCTYWIFKKIDRYEGIAVSIIEKYLRRVQSNPVLMQIDAKAGIDENIILKREKIFITIQKIIKYVPERLHPKINQMIESWYSQLCIDIFCLC